MKDISRRKFIGQASCAALGSVTFLNTLMNLKSLNAAAISNSSVTNNSGYKALVCLFQSGGNDSFNMLMPRTTSRYNEYAAARTNLAVPLSNLLPINFTDASGYQYGLNPSMPGLQGLFNSNKAAFVANVGTLVDYTNKTDFYNGTANLPLGLFSHSDQTQQWQTAILDERTSIGWGGKIADLIRDQNTNQNISMNISLSGTNIFQTGNSTVEYAIDPYNGPVGIDDYNPNTQWDFERLVTEGIDGIMEHQYTDIFKKTYAETVIDAQDAYAEISAALDGFNGFSNASFGMSSVELSFEQIAKAIAVRDTLGFQRQIFFIDYGGWDHHEGLQDHGPMLGDLDNGLVAFNAAMEELGIADDVLTFSVSEFGRTLTSNGQGSDHAWAGNVFMMGGTNLLNGGEIYGTYPSLALNSSIDLGGGVLIPDTSADTYFAEVAKWFGVPDSDLSMLFPQLTNFYNIGSGAPIGFLKI